MYFDQLAGCLSPAQYEQRVFRIGAIGLDCKDASKLENIININSGYELVEVSSGLDADIFLVNWDNLDSLRTWNQWKKSNPKARVIAVSEEQQELSDYHSILSPLCAEHLSDILKVLTSSKPNEEKAKKTEDQTMNILIVDDSLSAREFLKYKLENLPAHVFGDNAGLLNFKLETASNGKQAIELVGQQEFDLVFLDIEMPELDGYRVCETIKQNYPHLRVVLLSGLGSEYDRQKGYQSGCNHYITKPPADTPVSAVVHLAMMTKFATQPGATPC